MWQGPQEAAPGQCTYCQERSIRPNASAQRIHPGEPSLPVSLFPSLPKAKYSRSHNDGHQESGLRLMSWPYSFIQRGKKKYPDLSPVQENCLRRYSFHNVQWLSYQCCFLCAVQWQERYSAMLVHAHKIVLCPCLCRLKLETHYSINNNRIIYKLSGKFTTGRLWARQNKNFVEMNWKTFMQKFDCLPLSSEENFTSGLNLKMIEA